MDLRWRGFRRGDFTLSIVEKMQSGIIEDFTFFLFLLFLEGRQRLKGERTKNNELQVHAMLVRFSSFVLLIFFQHDDRVKSLFSSVYHPKICAYLFEKFLFLKIFTSESDSFSSSFP